MVVLWGLEGIFVHVHLALQLAQWTNSRVEACIISTITDSFLPLTNEQAQCGNSRGENSLFSRYLWSSWGDGADTVSLSTETIHDITWLEGFTGGRDQCGLGSSGRASWGRWHWAEQSLVVKPTHPPWGTVLRDSLPSLILPLPPAAEK